MTTLLPGMKTVRIFSDHIRDRIRLEGFRSVRIRVRIFNIWYRIRIRILKSYICDVDIQSYLIRHGWHYLYSNPNPNKNIKTNIISVIFVRIRSVFIPTHMSRKHLTSRERSGVRAVCGSCLASTSQADYDFTNHEQVRASCGAGRPTRGREKIISPCAGAKCRPQKKLVVGFRRGE